MPGTENPVNQIGGIDTVDPVIKADFVSWAKERVVQLIADANELRTFDLADQLSVILKSNGRIYKSDTTDTTTADDGVQCIRDFNGLAFKLVDVVGLDGTDGSDAGIRFLFDTSTSMADPGSGDLRLNNASLASVTAMAISELCAETGNPSVDNYIKTWDDSTTSASRGYLIIKKISAPQNFAIYSITAAITDNTTWHQATLSHVSSNGSFVAADTLSVQFFRTGDTGTAGSNGADAGIRWLFDSSTSMADPGSGDIRLNNATLASVTAIAVSDNCAESGNPSVDGFIATWDDSTTTAARGYLIIKKNSAPQNFAVYLITAALTDNTTWWQATVSHVASAGSFSNTDVLSIQFARTGNSGAGSGDLLAANNLTDLNSPAIAFDNLTVHAADVASASTINLDNPPGVLVDVTGTTTITAITLSNGRMRIVRFTGALTLTHGASLVLPNAQNITTKAGEYAVFVGYASSVVRCVAYIPEKVPAQFKVSKSGNQTFSDNTFTDITWDTESVDHGGFFASNLWTPPAGKVLVMAFGLFGGTYAADSTVAMRIKKNGGAIAQFSALSSTTSGFVSIFAIDTADGDDTYGIDAYGDTTGGSVTFNGSTNSGFMGIHLGG